MAHPSRVIRHRKLPDAPKMVLGLWGNLLLVSCILLMSATRFTYPTPFLHPPTATSPGCILRDAPPALIISCDAQRRLYVQTQAELQALMIERIAAHHGICLTSHQIWEAAYLPYVGVPVNQLPTYLNMTARQRWAVSMTGIPATAANNELLEYVRTVQEFVQQNYSTNRGIDLYLDGQLSRADVRSLIRLLQWQGINRYSLIVDLERR